MSLTEKNLKIVESFNSLKTKIDSLMGNGIEGKTHLQNYLYFVVAPVFNYTESIIILCKQGKFNAAHSLLRSLFEAHINIIYYQIGNTEKKLAIAVKKDSDWKKNVVNSLMEMIKKYPHLESLVEGNLYNKKYLEIVLSEIDKERLMIINRNQLVESDKEPSLLKKARFCDDAKIDKNKLGHFESMYHIVYRPLSAYTHLDVRGIEYFVSKDDKGRHFFKEEPNEDLLISEAIGVCVALVKDLYEHKVISSDPPEILNTVDKLIN